MSDFEFIDDFFSKLICEELSDEDVKEFKSRIELNPTLIQEVAERLAFTELVSQSLEEERSADCFVEMVKSSLSSVKKDDKNKLFVDSVKNKILQEGRRKPTTRASLGKRNGKRKTNAMKKSFFTLPKIVLSLAALLAIGFAFSGSFQSKPSPVFDVVVLEGELMFGKTAYGIGAGMDASKPFRAYQKVILGMKDGTEIELFPGTMLSYEKSETSRRFLLTNGKLKATVASQKKKSLYFETPFSVAEIIGTRFILSAENYRDYLLVEEGRVHFTSLQTDSSYFVDAGETSMVYRSGKIEKKKIDSEPPPIFRVLLIDRQTGRPIQEIENNQTIDLKKTGKEVNIVAEVNKNVKLVIFVLNGKIVSEEVTARYIPSQDRYANIMPWTPAVGNQKVKLIPYKLDGSLMKESYLNFNIIE